MYIQIVCFYVKVKKVKVKKVKVVFISSAICGPSDRSKRFTLFALPGRPVHSETNSASPGSILAMLQLRAKTKSLNHSHVHHCLQPGTHLYS